ncbi:NAD(P)H-binding protein [Streptomyces longwoodensis]|uniref:NAD(P)H-binding protein n=1 Tax=Streptomyces longwoodensis TaxID=68231 RepID=UPI0033E8018A
MIVVSAASGALGRLVVDRLLERCSADQVAAAVRDATKVADLAVRGVAIRIGEYDVPTTLRTAFEGADRLLLISSPELDPVRRAAQHRAAIDAARDAGVGSIVYTSFLGAGTQAGGVTAAHHATERHLAASGLSHTVLRHPFYSEAFLNPGLRDAIASGELADGTGGHGINTALRRDLAEAAARVLTEDGHHGRAYDFTGGLWTYEELADSLSRLSGRPVVRRARTDRAPGAQGWLEEQIRSGALEQQTGDLPRVLGRPATPLDEAVAAVLTPHSQEPSGA